MNKDNKLILVSSLALFSMFLGAGNLIFPPSLGLWAGNQFLPAALGFLLTAVGIVMLGVVATTIAGGRMENVAEKLGGGFATLFGSLIILSIGPGLAIPRTAATTYEVVQLTMFPNMNSILFSFIFFATVLFFVINPTNVIDALGKYLTPALVFVLAIIIIKGFVTPLGTMIATEATNVFSKSFEEGYQTMDVLAALAFTSIVIKDFRDKGVKDEKQLVSLTIKSGFFAALALSLVYIGLLYIGSTATSLALGEMSRVDLLVFSVTSLLGNWGKYAMSIVMALACLTTAIGLTSTGADFFYEVFKRKISYKALVFIITIVSGLVSISGVEAIVDVSANILSAIYPIAMVLIFLNLFPKVFTKKSTYIGAVIGASIPTVFNVLSLFKIEIGFYNKLLESIPTTLQSFIWILPAVVLALAFTLIIKE